MLTFLIKAVGFVMLISAAWGTLPWWGWVGALMLSFSLTENGK